MSKIVAVVPTIRPECHRQFKDAWRPLFAKHKVTLVTVWDGDSPHVTEQRWDDEIPHPAHVPFDPNDADLFCRRTDGCRNLGFVAAAAMGADFVLTLDDDCYPPKEFTPRDFLGNEWATGRQHDPIQAHLDALSLRVPLSWMNTAHCGSEFLRGLPYGVREEAPVVLSHGVWVGTPDFDGETQLRLERCPRCEGDGKAHGADRPFEYSGLGTYPGPCPVCNGTGKNPSGVPKTLPYYVGPVPKGVLFPLCGMNVMVRREALPYLYFAPMGADSGFPDLHRFADIFMGINLKTHFDAVGWACYTGASTVLHSRASDAKVNEERERLGRQWLEHFWSVPAKSLGGVFPYKLSDTDESNLPDKVTAEVMAKYFGDYATKRRRFAALISSIQRGK